MATREKAVTTGANLALVTTREMAGATKDTAAGDRAPAATATKAKEEATEAPAVHTESVGMQLWQEGRT